MMRKKYRTEELMQLHTVKTVDMVTSISVSKSKRNCPNLKENLTIKKIIKARINFQIEL